MDGGRWERKGGNAWMEEREFLGLEIDFLVVQVNSFFQVWDEGYVP